MVTRSEGGVSGLWGLAAGDGSYALADGTPVLRTDPSSLLPETFSVLASRLCSAYEEKGSPVLLAVSNGELCLCCEEDNSKSYPSLQLKVSIPAQFPDPSATLKGELQDPSATYSAQSLTWAGPTEHRLQEVR